MAEYNSYQYRLRAGSPMPTSELGKFVLHSFMAEEQDIIMDTCDSTIVKSNEFRGQGGTLTSANYSRLPLSEERYSGKITSSELYTEEKDSF